MENYQIIHNSLYVICILNTKNILNNFSHGLVWSFKIIKMCNLCKIIYSGYYLIIFAIATYAFMLNQNEKTKILIKMAMLRMKFNRQVSSES